MKELFQPVATSMVALGAVLLVMVTGCSSSESDPPDTTAQRSKTPEQQTPTPRQADERLPVRVGDPRITESSGVARSPNHPGVLYTHNDNAAHEVFAIDRSGTRAVFSLDVPSVDWEDIASTPDGRIWVGDIGGNADPRSDVAVFVFEEPEVLSSDVLPAVTYRFRYPDGAHDAEALLVDPSSNRIYIVTKQRAGAKVYAAPASISPAETHMLEPVQEAPPTVTGGDFSPNGSGFVLRNYGRAFFYPRFGADPAVQRLPKQKQGEAITFNRAGTGLIVGSEGAQSQFVAAPVP